MDSHKPFPAHTASISLSQGPRVTAIVVLFHPPVESLRLLLRSLHPQVEAIWFVDNTPGVRGTSYSPDEPAQPWEVLYLPLGENLGIAAAQNAGIRAALATDCTHVMLLDQDSFLPAGAVAGLVQAEQGLLQSGVSLAAVGPVFVDAKTGLPGKTHHHRWFRLLKPFVDLQATKPAPTDWIIASGSLIRAAVLAEVGLMREDLFIDAVDTEWGLRAKSLGLQSFVIPTVRIEHSVGDSFIRLFGVSVVMHSEVRNYYIARNWLYLVRVRSMGHLWRSGVLLRLAKFMLVHSWFTHHRLRMVKLFSRALMDGARGRLGRYQA